MAGVDLLSKTRWSRERNDCMSRQSDRQSKHFKRTASDLLESWETTCGNKSNDCVEERGAKGENKNNNNKTNRQNKTKQNKTNKNGQRIKIFLKSMESTIYLRRMKSGFVQLDKDWTVSKTTTGKFLRDWMECIWTFRMGHIPLWTKLLLKWIQ